MSQTGRQRTVNPYTSVPNETLRDESLSWGARGLLCWALSHSDEWTTTREAIMKAGGSGQRQVQRYLNELTEAGYRRVLTWRDAQGRYQKIVEWYSVKRPTSGTSRPGG